MSSLPLEICESRPTHLSWRARLTWLIHLFKACVKQHHRELAASFHPFIPADGVVLDVGGHAGQYAKLFARMAPNGNVYSVEPSTYALSILRPAIRFNRLSNITVLPVGLSDAPGRATLHTPIKRSGSVGFGLAHIKRNPTVNKSDATLNQTISLTTVDDLIEREGLTRFDFIKADIEGFEMRMICGAKRTLSRFRPTLMVEINRRRLTRAGDTPEGLYTFLTRLDYDAFQLTPGLRAFAPADPTQSGDVFFIPRERVSSLQMGPVVERT